MGTVKPRPLGVAGVGELQARKNGGL